MWAFLCPQQACSRLGFGFDFGPAVAQPHSPIEDRGIAAVFFAVGHKVTQALKLEAAAGLCLRKFGLDPALVTHNQGVRVEVGNEIFVSAVRGFVIEQAVIQPNRGALAEAG